MRDVIGNLSMSTYLVTTELKTSWWVKFLRWLHIKPKRNEFKLVLNEPFFKPGDTVNIGQGNRLLILRKLN